MKKKATPKKNGYKSKPFPKASWAFNAKNLKQTSEIPSFQGFFRRESLWVLVVFALFAASFLWSFITHPTWIPGGGDMGFVWIYRHLWIESLKHGYPMLWNPYSSLGQPLLANCNPQDYAPFNFLFFLMPTGYAFTWSYFCHYVVAALGAYLFVRSLGTGWMGACLSGMAFAFSAFFVAHLVWGGHNSIDGASWLPLILYGLKSFVDSGRLSALMVAAGAFGCGALDGTPQYDLYALMAVGFFLLWAWAWGQIHWKSFWAASASFLFMGLSLGLCQLAPTYQLTRLSERTLWNRENIMRDAFVPDNFHFFLNPFFAGTPDNYHGTGGYSEVCVYVGLIPLFLALIGMATLWRRPWAIWLGLVAALSMCLSMADTTLLTHYVYNFFAEIIPGLSQNRQPSRIMVVTSLALASLSGLALDAWIRYWRGKPRLSALSRYILEAGIPVLLLLGTAVDLYRFDIKHAVGMTGSDQLYSDLFPNDLIKLVQSDPTYPRVEPPSTYTESHLLYKFSSVYTDCTSFFIKMSKKFTAEQSSHWDSPLSDLIRVNYAYLPNNAHPSERWQRIPNISVPAYQDVRSLPRAFMVGGYAVEPDYGQAITEIRDGKVDPREEVILSKEPVEKIAGSKGWVGEAPITRYDYNDVEMRATNDRPCFLVLSDSYYPGWKACVDGMETPIYLADGALRAVPLINAGSHKVTMSYYPPVIVDTFFYSLLAWLALIVGWIFHGRLDKWCFARWKWLKARPRR